MGRQLDYFLKKSEKSDFSVKEFLDEQKPNSQGESIDQLKRMIVNSINTPETNRPAFELARKFAEDIRDANYAVYV